MRGRRKMTKWGLRIEEEQRNKNRIREEQIKRGGRKREDDTV